MLYQSIYNLKLDKTQIIIESNTTIEKHQNRRILCAVPSLKRSLGTWFIQNQMIRLIILSYQVSDSLWMVVAPHLRRVILSFDFLPASALYNITVDLIQQMHLLRALNGMLFLFSHESEGKWYQFIKYAAKQMLSHTYTHTQASQQHINHRTVARSLYNFPSPTTPTLYVVLELKGREVLCRKAVGTKTMIKSRKGRVYLNVQRGVWKVKGKLLKMFYLFNTSCLNYLLLGIS